MAQKSVYKFVVRAVAGHTDDGMSILSDKKPVRSMEQAVGVSNKFLAMYPHCEIQILNLKGKLI